MDHRMFTKLTAALLSLTLCFLSLGCSASESKSVPSVTPETTSAPDITEAPPSATPTIQPADPSPTVTPQADTEASTDFLDYDNLSGLLAPYHIRFGTVINGMSMNSQSFQQLLKSHFNSITAANEMKAYSLLDQKASMQSTDGMPVMNYYMADQIMDFAKENQIAVRGHNLVWDAYMCDWFFREGYQSDGAYADADTMKLRMKYYITEVITHFETLYPGVIYCWDVVNEAVGDSAGEYDANDVRHLRTARSGGPNCFYEHVGSDYVELAFLYAKDAVTACGSDIKLIYNDYNAFHEDKCNAICELVKSINSYDVLPDGTPRMLCDGVGMQGYIGGYGVQEGCLDPNDIKRIETAIHTYAALGVEVQITEMAVRNFDSSEEAIEQHAQFYQDLFSMFLTINQGNDYPLTGISIWAITDDTSSAPDSYTYRLNSPYGGLFTKFYKVKKAFRNVYELLKTE